MARPKANIEPREVEKLAAIGATVQEMADFFMCDPKTLHNRFSVEMDKGRANMKLSLRQLQMTAARNGNITMMIWLGKQILKQTDKQELSTEAEKGFVLHIKDYADKQKAK